MLIITWALSEEECQLRSVVTMNGSFINILGCRIQKIFPILTKTLEKLRFSRDWFPVPSPTGKSFLIKNDSYTLLYKFVI